MRKKPLCESTKFPREPTERSKTELHRDNPFPKFLDPIASLIMRIHYLPRKPCQKSRNSNSGEPAFHMHRPNTNLNGALSYRDTARVTSIRDSFLFVSVYPIAEPICQFESPNDHHLANFRLAASRRFSRFSRARQDRRVSPRKFRENRKLARKFGYHLLGQISGKDTKSKL